MEASHSELGCFGTGPFRVFDSVAGNPLAAKARKKALRAGSDHRRLFIYLKLPQYEMVVLRGPRRPRRQDLSCFLPSSQLDPLYYCTQRKRGESVARLDDSDDSYVSWQEGRRSRAQSNTRKTQKFMQDSPHLVERRNRICFCGFATAAFFSASPLLV